MVENFFDESQVENLGFQGINDQLMGFWKVLCWNDHFFQHSAELGIVNEIQAILADNKRLESYLEHFEQFRLQFGLYNAVTILIISSS